jgi:hypothetical protein
MATINTITFILGYKTDILLPSDSLLTALKDYDGDYDEDYSSRYFRTDPIVHQVAKELGNSAICQGNFYFLPISPILFSYIDLKIEQGSNHEEVNIRMDDALYDIIDDAIDLTTLKEKKDELMKAHKAFEMSMSEYRKYIGNL